MCWCTSDWLFSISSPIFTVNYVAIWVRASCRVFASFLSFLFVFATIFAQTCCSLHYLPMHMYIPMYHLLRVRIFHASFTFNSFPQRWSFLFNTLNCFSRFFVKLNYLVWRAPRWSYLPSVVGDGPCLLLVIKGTVSYGDCPSRAFSQSMIVVPVSASPESWIIVNDCFRFL